MDGSSEMTAIELKEIEMKVGQYMKEFREIQMVLQENLNKCIEKMIDCANDIDTFHRKTTIANVVGSSVGIAGGITTVVGLALTPFTFGASLIVSGIGIGVAAAGGVTGATASIIDNENIKKNLKKVEEIVTDIQKELDQMQEIAQSVRSIFKDLGNDQVCHAIKVGGRVASAAVQIGRVSQLGRIIATAARGAEVAAQGARIITALSGVLVGLFLIVDTVFIVKGAQNLKNGCKTKEAAEIRDLAQKLVNLRRELQSNEEQIKNELEYLLLR